MCIISSLVNRVVFCLIALWDWALCVFYSFSTDFVLGPSTAAWVLPLLRLGSASQSNYWKPDLSLWWSRAATHSIFAIWRRHNIQPVQHPVGQISLLPWGEDQRDGSAASAGPFHFWTCNHVYTLLHYWWHSYRFSLLQYIEELI